MEQNQVEWYSMAEIILLSQYQSIKCTPRTKKETKKYR